MWIQYSNSYGRFLTLLIAVFLTTTSVVRSQSDEFFLNSSISEFGVHPMYASREGIEVVLGYSNTGAYTGRYGVLIRDGQTWRSLSTSVRGWVDKQDMIVRDLALTPDRVVICFGSLTNNGGVASLSLSAGDSKWVYHYLTSDSTIFDVSTITEISTDKLVLTGSRNRYNRLDTIDGIIWIYGKATPLVVVLEGDRFKMIDTVSVLFPGANRIGKFAESATGSTIAGLLVENSGRIMIVKYNKGVVTLDSLFNQVPYEVPWVSQLQSTQGDPTFRLFFSNIDGRTTTLDLHADGSEQIIAQSETGPYEIVDYARSVFAGVVLDRGDNLFNEMDGKFTKIDLSDYWKRKSIATPILINDIGYRNDSVLAIATDKGLFYYRVRQNSTDLNEGDTHNLRFEFRQFGSRFVVTYPTSRCETPEVQAFDLLGRKLTTSLVSNSEANSVDFTVNFVSNYPVVVLISCQGSPVARFVVSNTYNSSPR